MEANTGFIILLKELEENINMEIALLKWDLEFFFLKTLRLKSLTLGSSSEGLLLFV